MGTTAHSSVESNQVEQKPSDQEMPSFLVHCQLVYKLDAFAQISIARALVSLTKKACYNDWTMIFQCCKTIWNFSFFCHRDELRNLEKACDVNGNYDSSFPPEVVKDFVVKEYVPIEKVQYFCILNNFPWMSARLNQCQDF
jgi:hypothetical protein